jgi:hypothetical protein
MGAARAAAERCYTGGSHRLLRGVGAGRPAGDPLGELLGEALTPNAKLKTLQVPSRDEGTARAAMNRRARGHSMTAIASAMMVPDTGLVTKIEGSVCDILSD